jgi:hypothetical protein
MNKMMSYFKSSPFDLPHLPMNREGGEQCTDGDLKANLKRKSKKFFAFLCDNLRVLCGDF